MQTMQRKAPRVIPLVITPRYKPTVDSFLVVQMPGEMMRCRVERVVDPDRVLVEIMDVPVSRGHSYRKGDMTGARRRVVASRDIWEALDDRHFLANLSPDEFRSDIPEEPKSVKKTKRRAK